MIPDGRWDPAAVGAAFDAVAHSHVAVLRSGEPDALDHWIKGVLDRWATSQGACILDIGAGGAEWSEPLSRHAGHLHVVDVSSVMLGLARELLSAPAERPIRFSCGDAETVLQDDERRYDLVLLVGEVLSYVPSPLALLDEVHGHLAPRGTVVGTYMRRQGLLAHLPEEDVADDTGNLLVFRERSARGHVPALWARAWSDAELAATIAAAGLQIVAQWHQDGARRGGFTAQPATAR